MSGEHESLIASGSEGKDEFGRVPCVHCGSLQYPGSPFCLTCGRDDPVASGSEGGEDS